MTDWREITQAGSKIADAVVIATQDEDHAEPAIAFAKLYAFNVFNALTS
jgi:predicted dehydrogenase